MTRKARIEGEYTTAVIKVGFTPSELKIVVEALKAQGVTRTKAFRPLILNWAKGVKAWNQSFNGNKSDAQNKSSCRGNEMSAEDKINQRMEVIDGQVFELKKELAELKKELFFNQGEK